MSVPELRLVSGRDASGRLPPHDLPAERTVLSDLLLKPQHVALVRASLAPSDFWLPAHRAICEALYDLDDAGHPIDETMVAARLRDRERGQYVRELAAALDASPAVHHVEAHVRIVREKSRLRSTIALLQRRHAEAYGDVGDVQAWIERTAGDVSALAADHAGRGAVDAREAASAATSRRLAARDRHAQGDGLSTFLESLDRQTGGLIRGEVTLVTAETGGGKSAFVGHMAFMVSGTPDAEGRHRKASLVFPLEMAKEDLIDRWACSLAQVDFQRVRRFETSAEEDERLLLATDAIARLPIMIDDRGNEAEMSFDAIRAEVLRQKALLAQRGLDLDLVVIDYIQLIGWKADAGHKGNKYDGLDEIGKRLKRFSSEVGAAFLVCAQLNQKGQVRDCPPIAMHAHNHWTMRMDKADADGTRQCCIRVVKQRNGPKEVDTWCYFHGPFLRFSDSQWQ